MRVSKSALFIFELMVIILVFTFAAAICTEIFAASFGMSRESRGLTMGAVNAQTAAEEFKAGDSLDMAPSYFDKDWNAAEDSGAAYYSVMLEDNGSTPEMKDAFVNVYQEGVTDPIYSLHVKEFMG